MPKESDAGLADIDDIKQTIERERASKPAYKPEARVSVDGRAAEAEQRAAADAEPDDEEGEGEEAEEGAAKPKGKDRDAQPKRKREWPEIKAARERERARTAVADRDAARAEAAAMKADNERLQKLAERLAKGEKVTDEEVKKPLTEAEVLARAEERLAAKRRVEENAKRSDEAYDRGVEAFGKEDFVEALSNVMGELNTDAGMFRSVQDKAEFLDQLMESVDNPERVLFMLGTDPDEAERIIALPERRRIAAFVKLSSARRTKQPVSEVPEPVTPIKGGRATPPQAERSTSQRMMTDAEIDAAFNNSMERRAERRRG